jgi:3-oxoacid CoA-transferase
MAKAAKLTIVEAENIVEIGAIGPDEVDLPGIFVDRVVPATAEKKIEILKIREPTSSSDDNNNNNNGAEDRPPQDAHQARRERIGKRASQELQEGFYVNLGVGIPTLAANYIPAGRTVWLQSENGMLGMGPYPTKDQVDPYVLSFAHNPSVLCFFFPCSPFFFIVLSSTNSTPAVTLSTRARKPSPWCPAPHALTLPSRLA